MVLDGEGISRLKGRRDRILAHLRRFHSAMDLAVVPFEVTQTGITRGTRINRSHVSELLAEMGREGLVGEEMRHVTGSGRRAKIYLLTPAGMKTASELVETVVGRKYVHFVESMPRNRHFFGRHGEAAKFEEWLISDSRLLAIKGIAGVGKTTFVAKMIEKHGGDRDVFWYRFYEWSTLKNLLGQLSEFLRIAGSSRMQRYLDSAERIDIFEALSLLEDELKGKSAVLVFDDYHRAEDRVVQFFSSALEFIERAGSIKIVVMGRYIPRFYDQKDIIVKRLVTEMELCGLDREGSRALLKAMRRTKVDFNRLYSLTGGNPLAIELLQDITDVTRDSDLTRYIQGEVYSKLAPEEKRLLGLVSVFRHPVALAALQFANFNAETVDILVSKGLLNIAGDTCDMHDMFRNFFYNRLTDSERKEFHGTAAGFCKTREGFFPLIERHYHLLKTGMADATGEALALASEHGEEIIRKGYTEEFGAILAMLETDLESSAGGARPPAPSGYARKKSATAAYPEGYEEVLKLRGEICDATGKPDEALGYYKKALESLDGRARVKRNPRYKVASAALCRRVGIIFWGRKDTDTALLWFRKGLDALGELKAAERCRLCGWLGWAYYAKGDFEKCIAYHRKELETAKKLDDLHELALANNDIGTFYHVFCKWDSALRHYRAALSIREKAGDRAGMAALYSNMASIYETTGDLGRAVGYYTESRKLLHEVGDLANLSMVSCSLGELYTQLGDFQNAAECLERSIGLAGRIGDRVVLAMANNAAAELMFAQGMPEKAQEHCNDSLRIASQYGYRSILGSAHCTMGEICAARDEWHTAENHFASGIEIFRRLGVPRQLGRALRARGKVRLAGAKYAGDNEKTKEAEGDLRAALDLFKSVDARSDIEKVTKDIAALQL
jgi:tetratricopeptide (TPR) repeat protein/DNA-binding PadR family transcriptional regulator